MSPPRAPLALLLALLLASLAPGADAQMSGMTGQPLVADLSAHEISITTGFSGTELLLFGATEGEGDVIVVVRGPAASTHVRRKSREFGIWINTASMRFDEVPSFYRVASSRPLDQITTQGMRQRLQIGIESVRAVPATAADTAEIAAFRDGLTRARLRAELWQDQPAPVTFLGSKLFRTRISFPPNVPTGIYNVEVFLVKDGREIGAQTAPMRVKKTGIGARIYDLAHRHAALYGLLAVAIAILAGWGASAAFRRG
jgi:uncharacterized protein (TIGR02186 family)